MTVLTDTQIVNASGGLVELGYSQITASIAVTAITAASGDTVIAPLTVVCDGSPILVEFFSPSARASSTASDLLGISLRQDGTVIQSLWGQVANNASTGGHLSTVHLQYRVTPSAGSHTFGVTAYVTSAARAGYIAAGNNDPLAPVFLRVSKIVQATQWPAVTTGTIICTSSTRPASPFQGQRIYETDTSREYVWTGSVWLAPNASLEVMTASAQTGITNNAWNKLTWPSATVTNNYGFTYSSGTLTVPSGYGGLYSVSAQIQWDSSAAGATRIIAFGSSSGVGGSTEITSTSTSAVVAYQRNAVAGMARLVAGSSYAFWVLQDSGANRATDASYMNHNFKIVRVGD